MENYFNYFTEIEEHFQRARGTGAFRLSSLDWALIEVWKDTGVPLEAVLRGIDRAFEKWHKRARGPRRVNSLAYCAQQVLGAAQEAPGSAEQAAGRASDAQPFTHAELERHFAVCSAQLRGHFPDIAASLDDLRQAAAGTSLDFEEVERRLTVLEEKIFAGLVSQATEEQLLAIRREMDAQLAAYRRKMTAEHLALVEKQFIHKKLLEQAGLSRLSLFYL